jgi:uncharacterized protein (TIGR02246 family)
MRPALGLLFLAACAAPRAVTATDVRQVLDAQAAAWNRGDLEAFVASYWDDPRLSFCGKSGVVRGRQDLLATYRRSYPDAAARGTLTFALLEVRALGTDSALVLGRYELARAVPAAGFFTLIVERTPAGLVITHDHTSGT